MTTCSRSGCGKSLRKDNAKGECSSGCLSPDAPPAVRAKSKVAKTEPEVAPVQAPGSLAKLRVVADALGIDADGLLEEFAAGWLQALREQMQEDEA